MKKQNFTVKIYLSAIFLLISFTSFGYAQRASSDVSRSSSHNRYNYDDHNRKSNSNLSDASDYRTNRNQTEEWITRYEREKDSYPRERKNRNNSDFDGRRRNYNYGDRSENYFHIDKSGKTLWDGKHWEVSQFPLKIYVEESRSKHYKYIYKKYVSYALSVWRKADDRINYTIVNSSSEADISVLFIENLGRKYEENYLGLTEYDVNRNNEIEFSKIQISLIKFNNELVSDGEIKATIIHELGHALGLGHSESEKDIMYPYIDSNHKSTMEYDELSRGDKAAIKDAISLGDGEYYVQR